MRRSLWCTASPGAGAGGARRRRKRTLFSSAASGLWRGFGRFIRSTRLPLLSLMLVAWSSNPAAMDQYDPLPGSEGSRGAFTKHLLSERLCRIEFCVWQKKQTDAAGSENGAFVPVRAAKGKGADRT